MGAASDWHGRRIGDRYQVIERIGEGGMATVLRAQDGPTGDDVALKVLSGRGQPEVVEHVRALFVQEFHALAQLSHPRIVRVFDYGVDPIGPFYSMELLDGGDLRSLSPMDWRTLCRVLVDVCSALSLMHSRRLVHRDITPANIRCTRDGQAKLIDLGAMAHVGPCREIVGTPQFLAPEVLRDKAVDPRSDLFALGATAYRALTGRHAYPARSLAELPSIWRQPPPGLSDLVPDIPPELDELVMGLLAMQPIARPESAAEVMERLNAIAGLQPSEQLLVRSAYLATPTMVGRARLSGRFQRRLQRTLSGRSDMVLITGGPGSGRTRFLMACGREGQVKGAKLLTHDGEGNRGDWSTVSIFAEQLVSHLPELTRRVAAPDLATFAAASVGLARSLGGGDQLVSPRAFDGPQARRAAVGDAFQHLFATVAEQQPLVLAVDDAQRLDPGSAAVLAWLSHESRRVLVLAALEPDSLDPASPVAAWTHTAGRVLWLSPLTREQTGQLLGSIFGEAPNLRLLTDQVYALGQGVPADTMKIVQHLVDAGVIEYSAGQWAIPETIDMDALPIHFGATLAQRVEALSPLARNLALHLAVATFPSLSLDECIALLSPHPARAVLSAIDELQSTDVCTLVGPTLSFANPGVRAAMVGFTGAEPVQRVHRALADMLHERAGATMHEVVHLELAEERERAFARVLTHAAEVEAQLANDPPLFYDYVQRLPGQWLGACRRLLAWAEQVGRPVRECNRLLFWIPYVGAANGQSVQAEARLLVERLRTDAGLRDYDALSDAAPDTRLQLALERAQARHDSMPEAARGFSPLEAIQGLARIALVSIGLAGRSLDRPFLAELPSLAPLAALSPALAVVDLNRQATLHALAGRYGAAYRIYQDMLGQLAQPGGLGLEPAQFNIMRAALMWAVGTIEITTSRAHGARYADALAESPLFEVNASRMRAYQALKLADLVAAEQHHQRVELLRMRNDPPQAFQGTYDWAEGMVFASTDDLPRIKQLLPNVARTADQFPQWRPCELFIRGQYQRLRGDLKRALPLFERGLSMTRAGEHLAWAPLMGAVLGVLRQLGRASEAYERGHAALSLAAEQGLEYSARYIEQPLALASADQGRMREAIELADRTLAAAAARGVSGIDLGDAHYTRARLAIRERDGNAFDYHAQRCAELYRAGENPVLTARYERLLRAHRKASPEAVSGVLGSHTVNTPTAGTPHSSLFDGCTDRAERARRALGLLMERDDCRAGALYLLTAEGPVLVAMSGELPFPNDMDSVVADRVAAELDLDEATAVSGLDDDAAGLMRTVDRPGGGTFVPLVFSHEAEGRRLAVTAVAVLCVRDPSTYRPPYHLVGVMSELLSAAGDVAPRVVA